MRLPSSTRRNLELVQTLRGEDSHGSSSWKERFGAVETAFWSMLMSFLVLVVMVLDDKAEVLTPLKQ